MWGARFRLMLVLLEIKTQHFCSRYTTLNSLHFKILFGQGIPYKFLYLNTTFGLDLLVLHTTSSMFGKFLVHAWRS